VLGHRERGHLQPGRFVQELVDAARAVEERELRVEMEMYELAHPATFADDKPQRLRDSEKPVVLSVSLRL
jgi:hypothetical protein